MRILGVSGVDGTIDFKRRHWPGLSEREYRIAQGHDSAAALVIDGELVAAVAEERISRDKHTGRFPAGAIGACLDHAGIDTCELDAVVHAFDYAPYRTVYSLSETGRELYEQVLSREAFAALARERLALSGAQQIAHVDHHLAHACSAYLTSGWQECLVVVVDGMGEAHGASVYHAHDGRLDTAWRISAVDSIGLLYSVLTLHLGFEFNADEYKVMGLAPYGDPERFAAFFADAVRRNDDGGWTVGPLKLNRSAAERETYAGTRRALSDRLLPAREPGAAIEREHMDAAAALQSCLDGVLLHLCTHFGARLGLRRLALAGGVALNTTATGRLLGSGGFEQIHVQPAAGDDGSALGAALHRAAQAGEAVNRRLPSQFYGPSHSRADVERAVSECAADLEVRPMGSPRDSCRAAAAAIVRGEVVGWYRGRMEFGPRALGHRSILADPGDPLMRERLNALVKMRESFRPFAPAVSIEQVATWFEVAPQTELAHMTINVAVRAEHRAELPAVTHVDGSARVQTVSADADPEFHLLLSTLGELNGRELVLNTSLNVRGEPIVNTPAEAVATFLASGIDTLHLDHLELRKR